MKFSAALTLALLAAINIRAQQPSPTPPPLPTWNDLIAKNYLPYHELTTEDFRVDNDAHPEAGYWVRTFVQPFYHGIGKQSGTGYWYVHITDWTIYSGFDKNESSRKSKLRDMKPYLPYAQALLDLNELNARKLATLTPAELPHGEGETLEKARAQLDDRVIAFCRMQSNNVEKEAESLAEATNHGQNQKKVRELAAAIKKHLAEIVSSTPPPSAGVTPTPTASVAAPK